MMLYPAMKDLLKQVPSRYQLVNVVAHRAREIAADADKAAEKIRATAEINRKTIDALNNIRTHVVTCLLYTSCGLIL